MNQIETSITYTEVKDAEILRKATLYGINEYIHAKIEPCISNLLPFPSDYEFGSCFLSKKYKDVADLIFSFDVRPDDVFLVAFPKSGSTWLSNIVWQLQHKLDFSAQYLPADHNYLELILWFQQNRMNENDHSFHEFKKVSDRRFDDVANDTSPRIVKSHLPPHFLPTGVWTVKPKLIYIYRNAKDVAVSWFHMLKNIPVLKFDGCMEDCFDSFLSDHIMCGPVHSHVKSYRKLQQLDNVLILTYEEMLANPFTEIKRISEFLHYTYNDDQLKQLVEFVSFKNMRDNATESPFKNK